MSNVTSLGRQFLSRFKTLVNEVTVSEDNVNKLKQYYAEAKDMNCIKCNISSWYNLAFNLINSQGVTKEAYICQACQNKNWIVDHYFKEGDVLILIKNQYKLPKLDNYLPGLPSVINDLILKYIDQDIFAFYEINQDVYTRIQEIGYRSISCRCLIIPYGYYNLQESKYLQPLVEQIKLHNDKYHAKQVAQQIWNYFSNNEAYYPTFYLGSSEHFENVMKRQLNRYVYNGVDTIRCFEARPDFFKLEQEKFKKIANLKSNIKNKTTLKRAINKLDKNIKQQLGEINYAFAKWDDDKDNLIIKNLDYYL